MFRWRYKKYPLEVCGNPINGFQYFLTIYSGTKRLRMLIDSGATKSLIGNIHLKGCSYQNTGYKDTLLGVSGEMQARNILLDYDLDEPCTSKVSKFNHLFSVALKKDNYYFNSNDSDFVIAGVLGYPIGIILDNGQTLASDDLSNLFPKLTVCLFLG